MKIATLAAVAALTAAAPLSAALAADIQGSPSFSGGSYRVIFPGDNGACVAQIADAFQASTLRITIDTSEYAASWVSTTYDVGGPTTIVLGPPFPTLPGGAVLRLTTDGLTYFDCGADRFLLPGHVTPTVTGLSPAGGFTTGGVPVVITGTALTGATSITFGGTAATGFVVDSATQITAVAPAHAVGSADVVVTTASGPNVNTAADDYVYAPAPVPTLSEWAMILFGLLLAGGAALHLGRRRLNA